MEAPTGNLNAMSRLSLREELEEDSDGDPL